jgi:hypothetical protein
VSAVVERHYVTFASPGTFFHETSTLPIERWDPRLAVTMAERVVERHGARPYGFKFETRLESDPVSDGRGGTLRVEPKTIRKSAFHHLGGTVETLAEVEARALPSERVLCANMRNNHWPLIVVNTNSYRSVQPFRETDLIVDASGEIVERGDDPKWVAARRVA